MGRTLIPIFAMLGLFAAVPLALAEGETVAAYGTGQIAITPTDRKSEASITAAVAAAQALTIPAAVADARATAFKLAEASGLNIGAIITVEQQQASPFFYSPFPTGRVVGQFNGKFCGTVNRAIFRTVDGKRKLVRRVRERKCFFPPFASASVEITFRAAPRA